MRWNGAIHTSAAYTLLAGVRATMRVGVMMILASAMRHSVGRPATGMGGGTLDPCFSKKVKRNAITAPAPC